jgi:CubicO group peptidase (beta-lactamase class C family)
VRPSRREFFILPALARAATARLDEAYEIALASSKHGGLLVHHRGRLIYERYFGRCHREATPNTASVGKAFTSIAAGILLSSRRRDALPRALEQTIFTPELLPERFFPLAEPEKSGISLGQLLAMTSGIRGNNPCYVLGKQVRIDPPGPDGWQACVDENAMSTGMWSKPGGGYSYATAGVHIVSMMIRRVAGMELQSFVDQRIARPLGWGRWGWGYRRPEVRHTPGGGGIAVRAPDMVRFGEMLLDGGRWTGRRIVPAEYVEACGKPSPFNPHYPYSLQFEVNADAHVDGAPRDSFWKTGSGGHCIYIVPSLELVVWKAGGRDDQYSESNTGIRDSAHYDGSREGWKPRIEAGEAARALLTTIAGALSRI